VGAVFEGQPEAVDALVAWCRRGPPGARVDDVRVEVEAPSGERGFRAG
jgi:acylphosphatase